MKRKLVYVCLLAMVAGGMMSFSYDIPEKQETGGREDRVISFPGAEGHGRYTTGGRGGSCDFFGRRWFAGDFTLGFETKWT